MENNIGEQGLAQMNSLMMIERQRTLVLSRRAWRYCALDPWRLAYMWGGVEDSH